MICSKCNKDNTEHSKFCRFCGNKFSNAKHIKITFSPRMIGFVVIIIIILGISYIVVPKVRGYFEVKDAISKAKNLENIGQYQQALEILTQAQGEWTTVSIKNSILLLEQNEQKYIGWQNDYNNALSDIAKSDYNTAQTFLQEIDTSYPQYSLVKDELVTLQTDIQNTLNAKIENAQQQASVAKAQAVKVAADAQAQAAQAAQEAQAAQARDAAQAAQEAQAAQAKAAADRRLSIINQLLSIYNNFENNGMANYNLAINYSNLGDNTLFLSYSGEAESAFKSAGDSLSSLENSYTNINSDISTAITNLENAVLYCMHANNNALSVELGTGDATMTNYYSNLCTSDAQLTDSFLTAQN